MGASSENFCLRWNDFESNVSGAFRDLRQEADFFDVTLGCPDGKSLQAHKVILSACSSTFKTMLRDTQRNTNSHHPYIFLRGVSFPDLSAVLDFMYHGEVNVAQEDLNSFLAVAEELQIKGLTQKEGGEPSKPKPSGSGAVKRPVQPSSENVSASSTPAVKKIRRSSPDLPEQGQIKTIDIKSDPEAGPSGASQAVNRDGGASADYADESGDFEDYGDYYGEGEGGDNGADGSMMEGGEEGAGGKDYNPGGVNPRTLQKRKYFADVLDNFIQERLSKHLVDIIYDDEELETVLLSYFESLRVSADGQVMLPKKNYLDSVFSNIKLWILTQTDHKVDISHKGYFPKLGLLLSSLRKEIKSLGRT